MFYIRMEWLHTSFHQGDTNPIVGTSEWEYLRNIGITNGVPNEVILKEDEAQHTLENARFSLEVLQSKGIKS